MAALAQQMEGHIPLLNNEALCCTAAALGALGLELDRSWSDAFAGALGGRTKMSPSHACQALWALAVWHALDLERFAALARRLGDGSQLSEQVPMPTDH